MSNYIDIKHVDGTFNASVNNVVDFENNTFIAGEELPNGEPLYTNVSKIFKYSSRKPHGYVNDSLGVRGTKNYVPELSYILAGILNGDEASIQAFIEYPYNEELVPTADKLTNAIKRVNQEIGDLKDVSYLWKMSALDNLNRIFEKTESRQYFDPQVLSRYYHRACSLITIIKSCDNVELVNDRDESEPEDEVTLTRHTHFEHRA